MKADDLAPLLQRLMTDPALQEKAQSLLTGPAETLAANAKALAEELGLMPEDMETVLADLAAELPAGGLGALLGGALGGAKDFLQRPFPSNVSEKDAE